MTPILAPLAAMARAVAAPRPEPPPVMRTATSFNCILRTFPSTFPWAFLLWTSNLLFGCSRSLVIVRIHHAAADQRFHMLAVFAADLVGDRADTGRARHRMAA